MTPPPGMTKPATMPKPGMMMTLTDKRKQKA